LTTVGGQAVLEGCSLRDLAARADRERMGAV